MCRKEHGHSDSTYGISIDLDDNSYLISIGAGDYFSISSPATSLMKGKLLVERECLKRIKKDLVYTDINNDIEDEKGKTEDKETTERTNKRWLSWMY